MATTDSSLLAPERVEALRALGGSDCPELAAEVARLFVDGAAEALAELEPAIRDGKASVVKAAAHRLRGSCGNVGATDLSDLCLELEISAEKREVDPERLPELQRAVPLAIEAVAQTFGLAA